MTDTTEATQNDDEAGTRTAGGMVAGQDLPTDEELFRLSNQVKLGTPEPPRFATWGLLEIMGHTRVYGYIEEVTLAGDGVLRVTIPTEGEPQEQIYGVGALFCLTPMSEEAVKQRLKSEQTWPAIRATQLQIPMAGSVDTDDDFDDYDPR